MIFNIFATFVIVLWIVGMYFYFKPKSYTNKLLDRLLFSDASEQEKKEIRELLKHY